jgi:hypothetical protein
MRSTLMYFAICSLVLALVTPAGIRAAEPGLVGWWNFDEGPGPTAFDASGNGNNGTLTGGVQWVAQETGGALEFDGSSGYVTIPFSESLNLLNAGDFTLTAWFKADAIPPENKEVFQQGDGNGTGRTWLFAASGTGEIRTYVGGGNTLSTVNLEADAWFHGAVVVTEGGATDTIQLYVNGQPVGAPGQRGMESCEGPYFIGCHKNLTNFWDGLIDDVRLYNRALSAEEIKAMVPPKLKARDPNPADGDVTVVTGLLQWTPGDTALLHDVYLGTDPNLGTDDLVQSRLPMTLYFHVPGLTPGTTYYWRVDEIEGDMTTIHTGDVWTFIARPSTAYLPQPADGANEASPDPNMTLTWWPGTGALEHHLYFGDNPADVNEGAADTDQGGLAETSFMPGPLEPLATYYWRVDEIDPAGAVVAGPVWSFTTFSMVDDFETYTDDIDSGTTIYQTWIDGYTDGLSNSTVGYFEAPFAEQTIVHSGGQSMPFEYNNVDSPFFSEAYREFAPARDWTAGGAETLVLYVSGNWQNGAEPLYVGLEDTGSRLGVVIHSDPDVAMIPRWTRWEIPLSEFSAAGVNLRAVKAVYLGLGDRNAPAQGGAGLIFIDDIRLLQPAPAAE